MREGVEVVFGIPGIQMYGVVAGAESRPSPAEAVASARNLITYYDIRLKEPQYAVLEAMENGIPEDAFIVWDVRSSAITPEHTTR